ncbi:hypothetical protein BC829DRAFT_407581, partial [Chytridium lagenaria]
MNGSRLLRIFGATFRTVIRSRSLCGRRLHQDNRQCQRTASAIILDRIRYYVPVIGWLPHYNIRENLQADV